MEHQQENQMGTKAIVPLIMQMSLPPLFSMFLQYTYNFVDCLFVAQISEKALTAVSFSFPLTTLMLAFSIGTGVGINVLVARYLGRKEQDEANNIVSHGLLLSFLFGILLNVIFYLILEPYFHIFIKDEEIYALSMQYMKICVFLQIPNMVHIAIQKILQGTGNMLTPMAFQTAGVVFNFIFDPILIFGLGPFPAMGIKGAAVSTVLGYTVSMLIAFYVLLFTKQKVKIKTKGWKLNPAVWINIFRCGMPSFIMNALGAFMVTFTNSFLAAYSMTAVAFFGAYFKAQQLVVMTVNGLIQGCIPIMSFNFGAGNKERLKKTMIWGTVIAMLFMGTGELILSLFPKEILKVFMASEEMMSFGVPALRIMTTGYLFNGIATMVASYIQSVNQIRYSIVINLLRQLVMLYIFMWLFSRCWGMTGVWISFPAAEIVTCICCFFIMKKVERQEK
ncbi:MATE family efflux transporter [Anaerobutyricum soehngenii]